MSMGFLPKAPGPDAPTWQHILYWIVFVAVVLGFVIPLVWKSFRIVRRGNGGIRTRNGKARKRHPRKKGEVCDICDTRAVSCETCAQSKYCRECRRCELHDEWRSVRPGIYLVVPGTDNIETTETQDRDIDLTATHFDWREAADDAKQQFVVDGTLTCAVGDDGYSLYEAIFEPKNLEDSLKSLARTCLSVAASKAPDLDDIDGIAEAAAARYNADPMPYGTTAKRFLVTPIPRSREQVLADSMSPGSPGARLGVISRGLEAAS